MRDSLNNKSVAPKLANSIYSMALDHDSYLSFDDQSLVSAPFTDACFYPDNFTINVEDQGKRYQIVCQGEASAYVDDGQRLIIEYQHFRDCCPDGDIDNANVISLESNKWFNLFVVTDDKMYDAGFEEGYVCHDIVDAVKMVFEFIDG
jgi:hypothetical protein